MRFAADHNASDAATKSTPGQAQRQTTPRAVRHAIVVHVFLLLNVNNSVNGRGKESGKIRTIIRTGCRLLLGTAAKSRSTRALTSTWAEGDRSPSGLSGVRAAVQRDLAPVCPTRNASFSTRTRASSDLGGCCGAIADPSRAQLLDCRAQPGNHGVFPEDYRGVEIPCTCIVRSPEVVEDGPDGQRFGDPAHLAALLAERGVSSSANKIAACRFGIGAAVVATALEIVGCGPSGVCAGSLIDYVQAHRSW